MTFKEVLFSSPGKHAFQARLYYNRVSPGKRPYIMHSHPAYEIGYFNNCSGTFSVESKQYSIIPGDIFIFRSNEQHYVTEICGDKDIVVMGLQFFPNFIWANSYDEFDAKYIRIFSAQNTQFVNRLQRNCQTTSQILNLLNLIEKEFETQAQNYVLMIRSYLVAILVLIMRQYDFMVDDDFTAGLSISSENAHHIQDVMDYIDQHLTEQLTLKSLASVANMSPSYFSQLFKELNGFSTWDYIISRRVDLASKLLITTNDSIYNVAFQSGFNNTTNFHKAFKKITGVSPTTYRK